MSEIAVLYLNDGTTEPVIGETNDFLRKLIDERLGHDCAELLDDILEDSEEEIRTLKEGSRDFESNADFYMGMCHDAVNGIEECISMIDTSKRLDKQELRKRLKEIRDSVWRNL